MLPAEFSDTGIGAERLLPLVAINLEKFYAAHSDAPLAALRTWCQGLRGASLCAALDLSQLLYQWKSSLCADRYSGLFSTPSNS